ncbi:NAD(P)-binding protein [Tomitella biformata]|uniref:NAD(P)-binding protein n=1 Tax=Tomitella biformata TaxID=630403 RepID=UPI0009FD3EC4|nr:NAD(P)-binding protein [Tomitella biformata]
MGAGPAGLSAAHRLGRARRSVPILDAGELHPGASTARCGSTPKDGLCGGQGGARTPRPAIGPRSMPRTSIGYRPSLRPSTPRW